MKRIGMFFPALLLIAGMVFLGCPGPTDPDLGDITWTLSANGAGDSNNVGTADTTEITITFSRDPAEVGLQGQNISIVGGPATISDAITSTGTTRVVPVKVTGSGSVSIKIDKTGIEAGTKSVMVWEQGVAKKISYTAVADGTENTVTSTKITFTFDEAVTGLLATEITITAGVGADGGAAAKDTLSGSGTTWVLNILTEKKGPVTVKITKDGIDDSNHSVTVHVKVEEGPPAIPEDGQIASEKWHKLEVDPSDTDADKQAENVALGKGVITGDDFDAIVAATAYQGTHLRIYLDMTGYTSQVGWGVGALGNLLGDDGKPSGADNLGFNAPAGNYGSVNVSLKSLKDYYDVEDGEIFVNIWNGAKIRAILLVEPIPAVPEEELPPGEVEFTLPETEGTPGKGLFGTPDVNKLNAAKPGSYLMLYGANAPGAEYDIGRIIDSGWANKGAQLKTPAGTAQGADFELKVLVADIKYALDVLDYDEGQKWANGTITGGVGLNIYNSAYLTKILLIEPDDGEDPPPPEPPEPPAFPVVGNLGKFTITGGNPGWGSNGADGVDGPPIGDFKAAAYIVLKVTAIPNTGGVGGMKFVYQGDHDNWGWHDLAISADWTNFATETADVSYFVLPLASITGWDTAATDASLTQVKFLIQGVDTLGTLLGAWLLEDDAAYTKPATATDLTIGYLVKEADFDWDLPGGELTFKEQITSDDYEWEDNSNAFKGKIKPAKAAEIKALTGVLRVYVTGTMGEGNYKAGWGVGKVGNPDTNLNVPGSAPSTDGEEYSFTADFPISALVLETDEHTTDYLNIDIWAGAITKIEIWTY